MASTKQIGCAERGCTETLTVSSPDDTYTEISITEPEGESIEREYECESGHTTRVYWYPKAEFEGSGETAGPTEDWPMENPGQGG
ncbi:MAG: hypothetical protein ABSD99_05050 [Candidatus Bathyarchaeia archaeon]